MKPIKIAIAEDHQLVRQGIISLLTDEDDLEVVIEAENGAILLEQLKLEKTDIVLLDLEMPVLNGQDALKFIKVQKTLFNDKRSLRISGYKRIQRPFAL